MAETSYVHDREEVDRSLSRVVFLHQSRRRWPPVLLAPGAELLAGISSETLRYSAL